MAFVTSPAALKTGLSHHGTGTKAVPPVASYRSSNWIAPLESMNCGLGPNEMIPRIRRDDARVITLGLEQNARGIGVNPDRVALARLELGEPA